MELTEQTTIRFDPVGGPRERLRFEPRPDGSWERIDEVWTGCSWRPRGRDTVESISIV